MKRFRHHRRAALLLAAALLGLGGLLGVWRLLDLPSVGRGAEVASSEAQGWAEMGQAFLQRARETGDPAYYAKADASFQKALGLDLRNVEAMGGMGSLCLSRHQFQEALVWGERARVIAPYSATLYGVLTDACIETGDYARATQLLQRMVDLRPGLSAYARISYLRELMGDHDGAVEAMEMAVKAGGPSAENTAWCQVQLGGLYFGRGDLRAAEAQYRGALARVPDYAHALAGLARVRAAQGDYGGAVALYGGAVAAIPMPQYVIELGDVFQVSGRPVEAERQYALVRAMARLYRANGVDTDLEMALFDADHGRDLSDAVARARREAQRRSSVQAWDALAWVLYRAGDYREARSSVQQALRLGTQDALMLFHAGMISQRLGERARARAYLERALSLNPRFSVRYAPEAEGILSALRAGNCSDAQIARGARPQ